jgi:hypothetical protein
MARTVGLSTPTSGAGIDAAAVCVRSAGSRLTGRRRRRAMVLDEFVVAHTVGWWAKALMLRHSGMYAADACVQLLHGRV